VAPVPAYHSRARPGSPFIASARSPMHDPLQGVRYADTPSPTAALPLVDRPPSGLLSPSNLDAASLPPIDEPPRLVMNSPPPSAAEFAAASASFRGLGSAHQGLYIPPPSPIDPTQMQVMSEAPRGDSLVRARRRTSFPVTQQITYGHEANGYHYLQFEQASHRHHHQEHSQLPIHPVVPSQGPPFPYGAISYSPYAMPPYPAEGFNPAPPIVPSQGVARVRQSSQYGPPRQPAPSDLYAELLQYHSNHPNLDQANIGNSDVPTFVYNAQPDFGEPGPSNYASRQF